MGPKEGYVETPQVRPDLSAQQLAEMFHHNLNLTNGVSHDENQGRQSVSTGSWNEEQEKPIKYSMSQHYTHSAHVAAPALHPLQPSSQDIASRVLISNDIVPSSLLRSQLQLFEKADDDQRSRLIELWRIVPPTYASDGGQELADRLDEYQNMTIAQELELAWLRYQKHIFNGDIQTDVKMEQLCGRKSLLGEYYGQASNREVQPILNHHSQTAFGQSFEGNRSWSQDLSQQSIHYQQCREQMQGLADGHDCKDVEML